MRYLVAFGLLVVVAGLHGLSFLTGASGLARILADAGAPAWAPWAGSAFLEVAKGCLLAASAVLLMTPTMLHRALGLVCGTIWLAAALLSIAATKGTVSDLFASKERAASLSTERRAFLAAELRDAEQQLARVAASRPVEVVRAEVERLKLSPRWTSSEGCTAVSAPESRALCDTYHKAFAEMASATNAAQVRARISELRRDLGQTPATASTDPMIAAFDLMLGRWLGVPGLDGVALLVVIAGELGSMFGLAMVGLVLSRPQATVHEFRRQAHPIDQLADTQVAQLTETAREMRATVHEPAAGRPQVTLQAVGTDGPGRCPEPASVEPSNAPPLVAVEGLAQPSNENAQTTLQMIADTCTAKPSTAAARPSTRTLQVVGSHTATFVAECFDRDAGATLKASEIWSAYERWTRSNGVEPVSQTKLGRELVGLGLEKEKQGVVRYTGLRLKQMAEVA